MWPPLRNFVRTILFEAVCASALVNPTGATGVDACCLN